MEFEYIGSTNIKVSKLCIGTMTFGSQNNENEAFNLLDYAFNWGINFIDLAEMYPAPAAPHTSGKSEEIVGSWLRLNRQREKVVLSDKVAGPGAWLSHIREGKTRLVYKDIVNAIEGSLKRLGTEYIDLYQIHWPERTVNMSGEREYTHDDTPTTPLEETLSALQRIVSDGKARAIGVSNETPWGVMNYIAFSNYLNLPRIQTLQNPYNLLNRTFEINFSEICLREKIGLLAYSPLAFGVLTGKYDESTPQGTRSSTFGQMYRYLNEQTLVASRKYSQLAKQNGLTPAKMALSYVLAKPFVLSCILGATNLRQLEENVASEKIKLSKDIIESIERIHNEHANPAT